MSWLWHAILYSIPWWVWLGVAIVAAVAIYRLFGIRWALTALAVLGAGAVLDRERQKGYADRQATQDKADQKAAGTVTEQRHEAATASDTTLDKEVDKWTRK